MSMKRGITAVDFFYLLVLFGFILGGIYAMVSLSASFSLDNAHEGIGFRQGAVINTYAHMDELMLYTELVAKYAVQEALNSFAAEGLSELYFVDEEKSACGAIGTYAAWNYKEEECFTTIAMDPVRGSLQQHLDEAFAEWRRHPFITRPVGYEYSIVVSDTGLRVLGAAQQEILLPVVGAKDDVLASADVALVDSTKVQGGCEVSSGLDVRVEPESDYRSRNGVAPQYIVLHYTAGGDAEAAIKTFRSGPLSIHYIVDRPPVEITRMVCEDQVAYHAGCSGETCLQENMNQQSIGVEIVNMGFGTPPVGLDEKGACLSPGGRDYILGEGDHPCWEVYPDEQLDVLYTLLADVASRWNIPIENIISHESISAVKSDPGPLFPWAEMRAEVKKRMSEPVPPPIVSNGVMLVVPALNPEAIVCEDALTLVPEGVYSAAEGRVIEVKEFETDGFRVRIDHGQDIETVYSGLTSTKVIRGQGIFAGTLIGEADELIFSVVYKGALVSASCFFSQASLAELGCARAASCEELGFRGIGKQSCFATDVPLPELDESKDAAKRDRTLNNINNYPADLWPIIKKAAEDNGLPQGLLEAVITKESEGKADADSGRAVGIMQFVPSTARDRGLTINEQRDDRLNPVLAIPAGARHLKFLYGLDYLKKDDYLVAQSYNSGQSNVKKAVNACGQNYDCIINFLLQVNEESEICKRQKAEANAIGQPERYKPRTCYLDVDYGKDVLEHMRGWGGYVGSAGGDVSCGGSTLKGVGTLRFKPNFAVTVNDALTPLNDLLSWAKREVDLRSDALHKDVVGSVPGWDLEEGFCDDSAEVFLKEVLLAVEECGDNGQRDCSCPVLPEEADLVDGEYQLLLTQGEVHLLHDVDLTSRLLARLPSAVPVQFGSLDSPDEGVSEIPVLFSVRDGKVELKEVFVNYESLERAEVYKTTSLWGFTSDEVNRCFETRRHRAFCAEGEQTLVVEGEESHPVVRFGLYFDDDRSPQQPTGVSVTGKPSVGLFSQPGLDVSFQTPALQDLSGVYVYCRGELDAFSVLNPVPERRVYPDEFGSVSFNLKECNGQPIVTAPGASYTVWLHSFDYGANENEQDVMCGNMETVTYQMVAPGPPPVYDWVSPCTVS